MKYPGILGDKYAGQLYPGGEIPLRVLTVLVAMSVNASVDVRDDVGDKDSWYDVHCGNDNIEMDV